MGNSSVVAAIDSLVAVAVKRKVLPTEFDEQLNDYVSALEGLNGDQRRSARELGARFVRACHADAEYPGEEIGAVALDIRKWLESVPK